jgi:hypothetical protein
MPIEVNVTDENVNVSVSGGVGPAGSSAWVDITGKPSEFVPVRHANDHGDGGADAIEIAASQVTGLTESLASLGTTLAGRSAYAQVATYAAMLALGTPSVLTTVRVTADENKGATNTVYQLWPNGSRLWIAAIAD